MWTLWLILSIIAFVVTKLFERIVPARKYVYPSEALIDQILPPEILEQIFLNVDYKAITRCHQVSKYWQYISSDKQLRNHAFKKEQMRIDPQELMLDVNSSDRSLDLTKLRWLKYPASYDPEWILRDHLLARRLNKKLIDVDWNSATFINYAMSTMIEPLGNSKKQKWLVKFRAKTNSFYPNCWTFTPLKFGRDPVIEKTILVMKDGLPENTIFKYNTECELIVELDSLPREALTISKVYQIRYINEKSIWDGQVLLFICGLLFAPCLLVDYRQFISPSTQYLVNLIITILATVLIFLGGSFAIYGEYLHSYNFPKGPSNPIRYLPAIVISLSVLIYFYNWTLEMVFLTGCALGCITYIAVLRDLFKMTLYAKHIAFISSVLVFFMVDWMLVVETIRSGRIFATLGYNLLLHLFNGIALATFNAILLTIRNEGSFIKNLTKWERTAVIHYSILLAPIIAITLFVPDAGSKLCQDQVK